jgi:hypothetical protein
MTLTMTISVPFSKSAIVAIKSVPKKRYVLHVLPAMFCTYCDGRTHPQVMHACMSSGTSAAEAPVRLGQL